MRIRNNFGILIEATRKDSCGSGDDFIDQALLSKTLYTSPYACAELSRSMILTEKEYTKHYFIESQRVTTKLGGGMANNLVNPISGTLTAIEGDVNLIAEDLPHRWCAIVSRTIL